MSTILDRITDFDTGQLSQLVIEHQAVQRTAPGKDYIIGRNTLVRVDGFGPASLAAAEHINAHLERVGFTNGRDKAATALRFAVLAEQFRDELTDAQHAALTASFTAVNA